MKLFKVTAKCGHVGKNYYVIKSFPVQASDGKEAARIARNIPRVKHHHKDAIISVEEITLAEYYLLIQQNKNDPYFSCQNIQDQRRYDEVVYSEFHQKERYSEINRKTVYYGKEILRNPKKFMRNIYYTERYAI